MEKAEGDGDADGASLFGTTGGMRVVGMLAMVGADADAGGTAEVEVPGEAAAAAAVEPAATADFPLLFFKPNLDKSLPAVIFAEEDDEGDDEAMDASPRRGWKSAGSVLRKSISAWLFDPGMFECCARARSSVRKLYERATRGIVGKDWKWIVEEARQLAASPREATPISRIHQSEGVLCTSR